MKLSDLKRAYPPVSEQGHTRFLRALDQLEEGEKMKKKMRWSLTMALVLVLMLAVTAAAVVAKYSVQKYIDPKFADQVTQIGEEYENEWMKLSINDAISDNMRMSFAMNMAHREGAAEVYVFPVITAESQGQALDVDIESGFELFDGVWLPEKVENPAGEGNYAADLFIMDDVLPAPQGDITWMLTFHVLRPNWPIELDPYSLKGYYESDRIDHEAYEQTFRDAYRDKKILLTYGDATVEYSAYLPVPSGMDGDEFLRMRQWEKLVRSGAFDEVDSFSRSFTTKKARRLEATEDEQSKIRNFSQYDLSVKRLSVTGMSMQAEFSIAVRDQDFPGEGKRIGFEAWADGKKLPSTSQSSGIGEDGTLGFAAGYDMTPTDRVPGEVLFIPYIESHIPQGTGENPLIEVERREAEAFTVRVGEKEAEAEQP